MRPRDTALRCHAVVGALRRVGGSPGVRSAQGTSNTAERCYEVSGVMR
jgi:hypothetical protein